MSRLLRLLEKGRDSAPIVKGTTRAESRLEARHVPTPAEVQAALDQLRPHLSQSLRSLPDDKLLALVNWHIMVAWERAR